MYGTPERSVLQHPRSLVDRTSSVAAAWKSTRCEAVVFSLEGGKKAESVKLNPEAS